MKQINNNIEYEFNDKLYGCDAKDYKLLKKYTEYIVESLLYFGDINIIDVYTAYNAANQNKKLSINKLLDQKRSALINRFLNGFIIKQSNKENGQST